MIFHFITNHSANGGSRSVEMIKQEKEKENMKLDRQERKQDKMLFVAFYILLNLVGDYTILLLFCYQLLYFLSTSHITTPPPPFTSTTSLLPLSIHYLTIFSLQLPLHNYLSSITSLSLFNRPRTVQWSARCSRRTS